MKEKCTIHTKAHQLALRGKNLKATPGRLALLDIFAHYDKPLSIKELKKLVGGSGPDMATLYRNTESLTAEGMLVRLNLSGKNAAYELASRGHHHHLICNSCGAMADVKINSHPGLNVQALKCAANFDRVLSHSLEFFGICKKCIKK